MRTRALPGVPNPRGTPRNFGESNKCAGDFLSVSAARVCFWVCDCQNWFGMLPVAWGIRSRLAQDWPNL
eukprot:431247-Pyramimonas_sp.AAC.1